MIRLKNSKDRVLILYYSSQTICGIGASLKLRAEQLRLSGWEVVFGIVWGRKYNNPDNTKYVVEGFDNYYVDGRTGTEEGRVRAIMGIIVKTKPRIVLLANLLSAFEAVKRLRAKNYLFYLAALNEGTSPAQTACLIENMNIIDKVICVNKTTSEVIKSFSGKSFIKKRIVHLPNSVPDTLCPHRAIVGKIRIGYCGRLDKDKRFYDLLTFWKEMKKLREDIELWVAGSGNMGDELKGLCEKDSHVVFHGRMSRHELYTKFYPEVDIFVHFSGTEGWPLAIGEAMVNGCVPVSSYFSGISREGVMVPGENCLAFPVGDIEEAIKQTNKLLDNPAMIGELGKNAKLHIEKYFSKEVVGNKWDSVLRSTFNDSPLQVLKEKRNWKSFVESRKETFRRLLRCQVPHSTAREEWPHYELCKFKDKTLVGKVKKSFIKFETEASIN